MEETESKPWQCVHCTYMNKPTWLACGMCYNERQQTNIDDEIDYPFYGDVLDEFASNTATQISPPAVATVNAATAAATTGISKTVIQPDTGSVQFNATYSGIIPVAQASSFINVANPSRTSTVTTDSIFTPYATAHPVTVAAPNRINPFTTDNIFTPHAVVAGPASPVSTDTIFTPYAAAHPRYVISPFGTVNAKNILPACSSNATTVKYTPYPNKVLPASTNVTYTNGARLDPARRLVYVAPPATVPSSTSNITPPVCSGAGVSRLRVINPRSDPLLFTSNSLATVTSTATCVPITSTSTFVNQPSNIGPAVRIAQPTLPAYNVTATHTLVPPDITGLFTALSNDHRAETQHATYGGLPMASNSSMGTAATSNIKFNPFIRAARPGRTETPLTFPTSSGSTIVNATAANPAPDSTSNNYFNLAPKNTAALTAPPDPLDSLIDFLDSDRCPSTSNPTVAPVVTTTTTAAATVTVKSAARVTTAAFATDSIVGWMCSYCTFTNDNLLLRCAVCDTQKPFRPVVQPQPIPIVQPQPVPCVPGPSNQNTLAVNEIYFECPTCYLRFAENEGLALENCGHKFCKNCLRDIINYSVENELRCPYKNRGVVCNSPLTIQEVGSILKLEYTGIDARPAKPNTTDTAEVIDLCSDNEDESRDENRDPLAAAASKPSTVGKRMNYQELLELDKEVLIPNVDPFDCAICMTEQGTGEGVVMRECLHTFCRECLKQAIKCNTDAEMKCPYGDGTTRCDSTLQQREIKALVDADVFEKHLKRSITEAESQSDHAFHCKTVDCDFWCEYEDGITQFTCPKCSKTNCINCKAIHTGMDCKQYQIKVQLNSANNPDDAKTNKMLQDMLKKGKAMHCPKCAIILSKVTGCDWLCCSMCKTEICWVTRGPRWGPKGHGDVSGGCKCRNNGKRCHPKCGNCH